jgi:hypothetical protein
VLVLGGWITLNERCHIIGARVAGPHEAREPLAQRKRALVGVALTADRGAVYLPKAASSRCASLTPAFCSCSRMIGVFTAT